MRLSLPAPIIDGAFEPAFEAAVPALSPELDLTLLSLLAEAARYGEELETLIEARGVRAWLRVGQSSLYAALSRLIDQGMLQMLVTAATPARSTYAITEAGRGILNTALIDLLRQPSSLGTGIELALANLQVMHPAQVQLALSERQRMLEARLLFLQAERERITSLNALPRSSLLFEHAEMLCRAELAWLTSLLTQVAEETIVSPEQVDQSAPTAIHRRTRPSGRGKQMQRLPRVSVE